jgi:hypothetical protein
MRKEGYLVMVCCVVAVAAIYFRPKDNTAEAISKPIESVSFKIDSVIHLREIEKQAILHALDSLKQRDTIFVKQKTRIFNNYYYENNRINRLSDSGQFDLLSKNIAKGLERERAGYYDVPNPRRSTDSQ